MKNTCCEIALANRYDLFCSNGDDAGDPMAAVLNNKPKQQQQQKTQVKVNAKQGGKKENQSAGGRGAAKLSPDKSATETQGIGNLHHQRGKERQGSKQNIRHQTNQKHGGVGGAGGKQGNALLKPRGTCPNHKDENLAPEGGGGNDDKYRKPGAAKWTFEAKEMTLDEWKAQKASVCLKPRYNLRKAGEGEDPARWDKMVALNRVGKAGSAAEAETRRSDTQKASAGGKGGRQVFDIEFHFTDNLRGWLGRMRRGQGMSRNGAGGWHMQDNVRRDDRPPFAVRDAGPDRSYGGGMNNYNWHTRAAPRVDDEHDFPLLR